METKAKLENKRKREHLSVLRANRGTAKADQHLGRPP